MFSSKVCYLLKDLSAELANSFLERIFSLKQNLREQKINIYIEYLSFDNLAANKLLKAYPEHCFILNSNLKGKVLVISAPVDKFYALCYTADPENSVVRNIRREIEGYKTSRFEIADKEWNQSEPRIMGILNITPDSFYDGGKYYQKENYLVIARKMIDAGADIIDIGGESSRPGADPVTEEEELKRVLPVVEAIRSGLNIPISVDTVKPKVAEAVLEKGANLINDISGLAAGKNMLEPIVKHKAAYCLMHTRGTPETMQKNPEYSDILAEQLIFFQEKLKICFDSGLNSDSILIDPGIGFGKKLEHNLDLLRFHDIFLKLGSQLLLGTSNKSFMGTCLKKELNDRLFSTISSQVMGYQRGATVFRVHDVGACRDALDLAAHYY